MNRNKKDIDLILSDVLDKKVAHIFEVSNDIIENVYLFTKITNKRAILNHIHQIIRKESDTPFNIHVNNFSMYESIKETAWSKQDNVNVNLISLDGYPRKDVYDIRINKLFNNYKEDKKRMKKYEASSSVPDKNTLVVYTDASAVFDNAYNLIASGYGIVVRAPGSDNIMYKLKAKFPKPVLSAEAEALALQRALKFVKQQIDKNDIPHNLNIELRSDNLGNVEKVNNYLDDAYDIPKEGRLKVIADYIKNNFNKNQISIKWVKGHHIDPYNIMVDQLAKESISHNDSNLVVAFSDKEIINKLKKAKKPKL